MLRLFLLLSRINAAMCGRIGGHSGWGSTCPSPGKQNVNYK